MNENSVLRVPDVCKILNISAPTLSRWRRIGHFPQAVQYGPNMVGWPRHVVDQWLAEKENPQPQQEQ